MTPPPSPRYLTGADASELRHDIARLAEFARDECQTRPGLACAAMRVIRRAQRWLPPRKDGGANTKA
jgi:hypothetical protein